MAVFTNISENELVKFLESYDIGKLELHKGISEGIQNTNYIVKTDKDKFILTIFEDKRILDGLDFFFSFTEHLADKGIPCPPPIHSRNGNILQDCKGKKAAIVGFLDGKWPRSIRANHCVEVGKYSALLHKAAKGFIHKRECPQYELLYRYDLLKKEGKDIDLFKSGIVKEIEKSAEYIKSNWPKDLPSGVVHGDIFPDNVLFEGEKLTGIIDFYMSRHDFYVADLANTLTQWCFENKAEFNITKARALLSAYNNERKLNKDELKALPVLAAAAAMKWFLTRLHTWFNPPEGEMVNQKDPLEQLEKLRFHLQVQNVSEYGLDL